MTGEVVLAALVAAAAAIVVVLWLRGRGQPTARGPAEQALHLGTQVLVGIGRPRSAPALARLGAALAQPEDGQVTVLSVVPVGADAATREGVAHTLDQARAAAREADADATVVARVDTAAADGLLHASVELDASLLVIGWPAGGEPTSALQPPVDRMVSEAPCPLLIARLDSDRWDRVVLHADELLEGDGADAHAHASHQLAVETLCRIAEAQDVPAVSSGPVEVPARWGVSVPITTVEVPDVGGPYGVADELTIVPVAPDKAAVADAIGRARPVGDVILALSHGVDAERRRALLTSARELLGEAGADQPGSQRQTPADGGQG